MSRPKYLTAADAAQILKVTPATVRQMAERGKLPVSTTTMGGIRLFHRRDVNQLADERQRIRESKAARRDRES